MMKRIKTTFLLVLAVAIWSCEDKIDLDLESGRSQLVVDAFLSSDTLVQTIRLTKTADYFLNAPTPSENNAQLRVVGPGNKVFDFTSDGNGNFQYDPKINGALDSVGFAYKMELAYAGFNYISYSVLNPVPKIDSMTYSLEEAELGSEEGYYTQFFARDFAGRKDYYWIRAFKNGQNVYSEDRTFLILSEDAAFGGEGADGFEFILPLRSAITNDEEPFQLGDVSGVELYSLNETTYEFLDQVVTQSQDGGLFSVPPANIRSNIFDEAGNIQEEVLGVFSLSSVSKSEITIQ